LVEEESSFPSDFCRLDAGSRTGMTHWFTLTCCIF
jgi:hypothetical protein